MYGATISTMRSLDSLHTSAILNLSTLYFKVMRQYRPLMRSDNFILMKSKPCIVSYLKC